MEGCPRLPTLGFDLKLAIESVNICEKIPNYITTKYQENGENFSNECEQINRLRQNAINCSIDENGLYYLRSYYCQLQLLRNRFPMFLDSECAVRFTWEDGHQREDNTHNDIRFEESCILYNIGALYSKLGANETRKTHESMKNACTFFRYSAACFEKLRDQYALYSLDLTPDLLTCQIDILLAQAHEAVLEKSFLDQRPPSVNAHIAMQIAEYYQSAFVNLMKPAISSIASKRCREWRVTLTYKISYYLAITYYCCGIIAEENKKRGETVCYFENAVERLKDGWKNAEKISSDKTSIYKDAHTFTNDILMAKYKAIKRDNDSVYFEKVPALSSLPVVQGVVVAKPQTFDCHDPDISGPDIFQKLVPMDTHLATSEYSEEKAKLLREIIELINNKNRELETFMSCLQLDRIPLNNEYLRLPRELLDCCATVINRGNMSNDLVSAMQQLNSQHHDVTEQINQFEQSLQTFEEINESIKSNKDYKDLQTNLKTIRDMLLQADVSNTELHRHMTTLIEHLKILNSPMDQLEKALPTISELNDEANKPKFARLGLLNEKIETMKKQRETLSNDFRHRIQTDDITKLILMRQQENYKNLFSEQIKKHEEIINLIKQNCTAQDNILQSLTEANVDIGDIRTKLITAFESRQRTIREYVNSFKSFDDTLAKANEGVDFYKKQNAKLNSLNELLITLQSQQQQQQQQQKQEKPAIIRSASSQKNVPKPERDLPTIPDRPRLKDYLAAMKPETWGSTKSEENMYKPSPMPNMSNNLTNYYQNTVPSAGPLYSNMPAQSEQTFTSFNPPQQQVYQVQSPTSMPFAPPQPTPFAYNQLQSFDQNFSVQPPMHYNHPPATQSLPQQQYYPSQSFQPQQSVYQPPPPSQTMPTQQSGLQNPSIYQYQNISDQNRSNPQSLPSLPAQLNPYRPQPVGAYEIPKSSQTTFPPLLNPQDIYRPGGLLGMNQSQVPSSTMNNNNNINYDQNQYVPYIPSASVSASFANLSINSMSNH